MDPIKTGKFIKELRTQKKLTQKGLAEKLGCSDKAISRWETGKGFPDVTYLLDLSEILEVNVNELLLGNRINKNDCEKINNEIIVNTIFDSKKKINKLIITIIILLFILMISSYYIPVAIMTPTDTMGVIFIHILGFCITNFLAGFTNTKIKWAFPIISFICYLPMIIIFNNFDMIYYALFFLADGYILCLISNGLLILTVNLKRRFSISKTQIKEQ